MRTDTHAYNLCKVVCIHTSSRYVIVARKNIHTAGYKSVALELPPQGPTPCDLSCDWITESWMVFLKESSELRTSGWNFLQGKLGIHEH